MTLEYFKYLLNSFEDSFPSFKDPNKHKPLRIFLNYSHNTGWCADLIKHGNYYSNVGSYPLTKLTVNDFFNMADQVIGFDKELKVIFKNWKIQIGRDIKLKELGI